jgi:hypothetical protein
VVDTGCDLVLGMVMRDLRVCCEHLIQWSEGGAGDSNMTANEKLTTKGILKVYVLLKTVFSVACFSMQNVV